MKKLALLLPALMLLGGLCSCTDEESELGMNIVDGNTLYNGKTHTLTIDRAVSVRDDSLLTSNYNFGIIGNYHDATFGQVTASLYTQISLPDNSGSINFSQVVIDSVVLTLIKDGLFPDSSHTYNFHFEVVQLEEPLLSDTLYFCSNTLSPNTSAVYFDDVVSVSPYHDTISMKLAPTINQVLTQTASAEEFSEATKGLRIRLTNSGDEGMISINMAATMTCLTVYYRNQASDTTSSQFVFLMGTSTSHFQNFSHTYNGTLDGSDSLDGSTKLYFEPLGGYNIYLSFDNALRAFAAAHPYAAIHHAELLLPVADDAPDIKPSGIMAMTDYRASLGVPIVDYAYGGTDGYYNSDTKCYRLRVTHYLQDLMRNGKNSGMTLLLDSRISNAARTFINGTTASNPIRIEIVYTE